MSEVIHINVTTRNGENRVVASDKDHQTLMQLLFDEDIGVEASCGGCASCATCHVFIDQEFSHLLPERDQAELMLLQYAEHYDPVRSRLSCQIELKTDIDGLSLTIAPEEW